MKLMHITGRSVAIIIHVNTCDPIPPRESTAQIISFISDAALLYIVHYAHSLIRLHFVCAKFRTHSATAADAGKLCILALL